MSENSVIQMYGTADTDGSAVIDVPDDGVLLAVQMHMINSGYAADGDFSIAQLSFSSVSQFLTNDARGVLAMITNAGDLSGAAANTIRGEVEASFYLGDGVKVFGGERLYLHVAGSGNLVMTRGYALLLFNFKNFVQRRR